MFQETVIIKAKIKGKSLTFIYNGRTDIEESKHLVGNMDEKGKKT